MSQIRVKILYSPDVDQFSRNRILNAALALNDLSGSKVFRLKLEPIFDDAKIEEYIDRRGSDVVLMACGILNKIYPVWSKIPLAGQLIHHINDTGSLFTSLLTQSQSESEIIETQTSGNDLKKNGFEQAKVQLIVNETVHTPAADEVIKAGCPVIGLYTELSPKEVEDQIFYNLKTTTYEVITCQNAEVIRSDVVSYRIGKRILLFTVSKNEVKELTVTEPFGLILPFSCVSIMHSVNPTKLYDHIEHRFDLVKSVRTFRFVKQTDDKHTDFLDFLYTVIS